VVWHYSPFCPPSIKRMQVKKFSSLLYSNVLLYGPLAFDKWQVQRQYLDLSVSCLESICRAS
jgi:hypothetical protein